MGKLFDTIKSESDESGLMWELVESHKDMVIGHLEGKAVQLQFQHNKFIMFCAEDPCEVRRDLSQAHRITYFNKYLVIQDGDSYAIFRPIIYIKKNDNEDILQAMGLGASKHKQSVLDALKQVEMKQWDYSEEY